MSDQPPPTLAPQQRVARLPRWSALVAATLLPTLAAFALMRPPDVGSDGPPSEVAAAMDQRARAGPADVVIVGDSSAELDLNADVLSDALGDPPLRTVSFARSGGSTAPVWYTILRDRVYANGLHPRLVVLGAYLSALSAVGLDDDEYALLREQVNAPDALLSEKTWRGGHPPAWELALDRVKSRRSALLTTFRSGLVGWWYGDGGPSGSERVTVASTAVFGGVHADAQGQDGVPGAQSNATRAVSATSAAKHVPATSPAETYLPALAAMVAEHGGRLVLVVPPSAAGDDPKKHVSAEFARGMAQLAGQLGVGWLDETDRATDPADFADSRHLNTRGAQKYTRAIADRLQDIGALGTGSLAAPLLPPIVSVAREGEASDFTPTALTPSADPCRTTAHFPGLGFLSDDGLHAVTSTVHSPLIVEEGTAPLAPSTDVPDQSCWGFYQFAGDDVAISRQHADGPPLRFRLDPSLPAAPLAIDAAPDPTLPGIYWVYPGTALVWTFESPWTPPDPTYDVDIEVLRVDPAGATDDEAVPELTIMGQPATLLTTATGYRAHVAVPSTSAPWSLRLSSPARGHYLIVREVTLSQGGQRVRVVRQPFWPRINVVEKGAVAFTGRTPEPLPVGTVYSGKPSTMWMAAPFPDTAGCSQLRVTENGHLLTRYPRVDAYDVFDPMAPGNHKVLMFPSGGGAEHVGNRVWVSASDDSDAASNGRSYQIVYDGERKCWHRECPFCPDRAWADPGDHLTLTLPADARQPLRAGVYGLMLNAVWDVDPAPDATVHVHIEAAGVARYDADVPVAELNARELPIRPPLRRGDPGDLDIIVDSPAENPAILFTAYGVQD